jgi:hypothetical protein
MTYLEGIVLYWHIYFSGKAWKGEIRAGKGAGAKKTPCVPAVAGLQFFPLFNRLK